MSVKNIDHKLRELVRTATRHLNLPDVAEVVLPAHMLSASESDAKHDKFGLVVLEDGNAGFFYRLLNVQPDRVEDYRAMAERAKGQSVVSLLENLTSNDLFERAITYGAINAATAATFQRTGFVPAEKKPTTDTLTSGCKVGMVGYFREQARQLVARGYTVHVLEINQAIVADVCREQPGGISASADPESLRQCDIVYCTASTLINGTLDSLLQALDTNLHIELVGPSAGCFPDPLFERGINVIGGSLITDINTAIDRIKQGKPWRNSVRKCTLEKGDYPGLPALLKA